MAKQRIDADSGATAQRGARVIGLDLLDALGKAHERYVAGEQDALHDVRVAVRRLRTWLRAYEPVLEDTVSKKSRRAVRELAEETAVARDAEVALEMFSELPAPPPRTRTGHADLQRRLERETARSRGEADEALGERIPRVVKRLTRELSHYQLDVPVDGDRQLETMATFSADVVEKHGERLARALEQLDEQLDDAHGEPPDPDAMHDARISAKRLRYIVERVSPKSDAGAALIERLTSLQDTLGEFRDARALADRALAEIGRSARSDSRARARALLSSADVPADGLRPARSRVRPGLMQVARGADMRARKAWQRFAVGWPHSGGVEQLRADVAKVVDGLTSDAS
jgi:CHAD domain-containing protein